MSETGRTAGPGATAVSRLGLLWRIAVRGTASRNAMRSRSYRAGGPLASLLRQCSVAFVLGAAGCLNPLYFDDVEVTVNHAPVLLNVQPAPTFGDLEVNVGEECAPITFRADRLEDADFDTLTVRYSMLVPRGPGAARVLLLEEELAPLEEPLDNAFYDLRPFELTGGVLRIALGGDLDFQVREENEQLLELRVSDGGFKAGSDDVRDGAALEYVSWSVKLRDTPCAF